jgi:hypothetical protein
MLSGEPVPFSVKTEVGVNEAHFGLAAVDRIFGKHRDRVRA